MPAGSDRKFEMGRPGSVEDLLRDLSYFSRHVGLKAGWIACDFHDGHVLNPRWKVRRGSTPTVIYAVSEDPTDILDGILRKYLETPPIDYGRLKVYIVGHRVAFAKMTQSFRFAKEKELEQFTRVMSRGHVAAA